MCVELICVNRRRSCVLLCRDSCWNVSVHVVRHLIYATIGCLALSLSELLRVESNAVALVHGLTGSRTESLPGCDHVSPGVQVWRCLHVTPSCSLQVMANLRWSIDVGVGEVHVVCHFFGNVLACSTLEHRSGFLEPTALELLPLIHDGNADGLHNVFFIYVMSRPSLTWSNGSHFQVIEGEEVVNLHWTLLVGHLNGFASHVRSPVCRVCGRTER